MSSANQKPAPLAIPAAVQLPAERVVKAPSAVVTCTRVIPSGDATQLSISRASVRRIVAAESHSAVYRLVRALRSGNPLCVAGAPASQAGGLDCVIGRVVLDDLVGVVFANPIFDFFPNTDCHLSAVICFALRH